MNTILSYLSHCCVISVKCAIQTGSLFGTDEENFSGFCFATLDLFLLLLLFSVYVLFVSFSLGCSEQKTDRDGEMEKDTTNTQHTSTWHFQRANEQTNGGKFMERVLARDFSQHYQWNMHHDCVHKSRGLIPKDTNI